MQVDKLVQVGHSVRCTSMQLRLDEVRLGSMRLLGRLVCVFERCWMFGKSKSWEEGVLGRKVC